MIILALEILKMRNNKELSNIKRKNINNIFQKIKEYTNE